MTKKKIIFFDIDGTLISETTNEFPESTLKALKMAKDNGHLLFINTGRAASNLDARLMELDLDGFICGCGTYVEHKGEILLSKKFDSEYSKELVKNIRNAKLDGILESSRATFYDEVIYGPEVRRIKDNHYTIKNQVIGTFDDDDVEFDKFVVWSNEKSDFDSFYEIYKNDFDFIKRDYNFYEIVPKGYSKASGIKFITEALGIDHENTYAAGDSTNDLAMLEYAAHSIAMGNSNPAIFDKAEYITTNIDDDGIYNALKHYNLI